MFKVGFLGTSGSAPTKSRGLSSVAVSYDGSLFLFDCGEGTQRQMLKFNFNIFKIKCIFISHTHGDHILGLPGLVRSLDLYGRDYPLNIYVPSGYEDRVISLVEFDSFRPRYGINIIPIDSGVIYSDRFVEVKSFELNHSIKSLGYVIYEKDKRKFDGEKCNSLGIKGEMFKQLIDKGNIVIGKKVIGIDEVSRIKKGKRIVYATDSTPVASTVNESMYADLLIHESTYSDDLKDLAEENKHSTAKEAGEIAKEARVKQLAIFHYSTRYRSTRKLLNEAKSMFPNTIASKDGLILQI